MDQQRDGHEPEAPQPQPAPAAAAGHQEQHERREVDRRAGDRQPRRAVVRHLRRPLERRGVDGGVDGRQRRGEVGCGGVDGRGILGVPRRQHPARRPVDRAHRPGRVVARVGGLAAGGGHEAGVGRQVGRHLVGPVPLPALRPARRLRRGREERRRRQHQIVAAQQRRQRARLIGERLDRLGLVDGPGELPLHRRLHVGAGPEVERDQPVVDDPRPLRRVEPLDRRQVLAQRHVPHLDEVPRAVRRRPVGHVEQRERRVPPVERAPAGDGREHLPRPRVERLERLALLHRDRAERRDVHRVGEVRRLGGGKTRHAGTEAQGGEEKEKLSG